MIRVMYAVFAGITATAIVGAILTCLAAMLWRWWKPSDTAKRRAWWLMVAVGVPMTFAQGWMLADTLEARAADAARSERLAMRAELIDGIRDVIDTLDRIAISHAETRLRMDTPPDRVRRQVYEWMAD